MRNTCRTRAAGRKLPRKPANSAAPWMRCSTAAIITLKTSASSAASATRRRISPSRCVSSEFANQHPDGKQPRRGANGMVALVALRPARRRAQRQATEPLRVICLPTLVASIPTRALLVAAQQVPPLKRNSAPLASWIAINSRLSYLSGESVPPPASSRARRRKREETAKCADISSRRQETRSP